MRGLLAVCLLLAGCASKSDRPRVRIANDGPGLQMWCLPLPLAGTLGYYKDVGIDVDLQILHTRVTEALIGGSADVAALTYDSNVVLAGKGQRLRTFFIMTRRDGKVLIVSPKASGRVHRPEDLKGALVAVPSAGSGTNRWVHYYLAIHGIAESQFSAVAIGRGASAIAAIENGRVDAAALTGGDHFYLLKRHPGLLVLTDLSTPEGMQGTYGEPFASGNVLAKQEWLDRNPDTARRLARAWQRTLQWIAAHTPEEIRERLPEGLRTADAAVDCDIIRWGKQAYTTDGAMPKGAPDVVKKYVDATNPELRDVKIDLASTWTNEYLPGPR